MNIDKIQFGEYKLENTTRNDTTRNIQLGKYTSENKNRKRPLNQLENTLRKIQVGKFQTDKTVRTNTNRRIQIEKTKNWSESINQQE